MLVKKTAQNNGPKIALATQKKKKRRKRRRNSEVAEGGMISKHWLKEKRVEKMRKPRK